MTSDISHSDENKADSSEMVDESPGHEIFLRFPRWQGEIPEGHCVNFLGVKTKIKYFTLLQTLFANSPDWRGDYPIQNEEYFEWIDLLEAVANAKEHFRMIELGAGWGRWICNAAAALKQVNNLPYTLIGVEAEPTHFQWMMEHLAANGVDLNCCQLIQAAVAASDGEIGFDVGDHPRWGRIDDWYGQSIGGSTLVKSVSLNTLLEPLESVDLIDLDVQGAEYEILKAAAHQLQKKVKRVHIETHNRDVELGLRELFSRIHWINVYDYLCAINDSPSGEQELWENRTEFGSIKFQGGVQTWLNAAFVNPEALIKLSARPLVLKEKGYGYQQLRELRESEQKLRESELKLRVLEQKFHGSERKLSELQEKLDESLEIQQRIFNSSGWRFLERMRRLRELLAP